MAEEALRGQTADVTGLNAAKSGGDSMQESGASTTQPEATSPDLRSPITITPTSSGKVRDLYDLGDTLLFVATDSISAFDFVLPDKIPNKGRVLTQISLFWFEFLEGTIQNHLVSADTADLPAEFLPWADWLDGRFMIVKKAQMLPIECIVRGYLAGSGFAEYKAGGTVSGLSMPQGLENSSKLPHALFTPSTKAELGMHDENISFERCAEIIGAEEARQLRDSAIEIYTAAADYAIGRGIIIADTKFEFGKIDGQLVLADEVLTPDSSRFWPADRYAPGRSQQSFDKQFVRDWLADNWDRSGDPPHMPRVIIEKTAEKYIQAYDRITGRTFAW